MKLNTLMDVLNSIPELIKGASMLLACAMIPGTAGSAPTQTPAQSAKGSALDVGPGRIAWFDIHHAESDRCKGILRKAFRLDL